MANSKPREFRNCYPIGETSQFIFRHSPHGFCMFHNGLFVSKNGLFRPLDMTSIEVKKITSLETTTLPTVGMSGLRQHSCQGMEPKFPHKVPVQGIHKVVLRNAAPRLIMAPPRQQSRTEVFNSVQCFLVERSSPFFTHDFSKLLHIARFLTSRIQGSLSILWL